MVKIAVLVKQVPSADSRLTLNLQTHTLERSLTDPVLNPSDLHAVEAALRIAEETSVQTVAVSMGPEGLEQSTKRALAMGIDESINISDNSLQGADVWMTATVLAKAIQTIEADLVFTGSQTTDGNGGVVPAYVAGLLGWNFVEAEDELTLDSVLNSNKPSVVVIGNKLNSPRLPNFKGIAAAKNKPVTNLDLAQLGLAGIAPKVQIVEQSTIGRQQKSEKTQGTSPELAQLVLKQIETWSESENTNEPQNVLEVAANVEVFEADSKSQAAVCAAEKQAALITDVVSASEGKFVKEIFDGQIKVTLQVTGPAVITKAPNPQIKGLAVGVGGGVAAIEDLREVANRMNAEVVGTAAAIDKGFIEVGELVGESGRTISPRIYLSFGVSGAHYHMVGLTKSKYVIAVNKDPEAEIFQKADLSIVADANEILSELVKALGK